MKDLQAMGVLYDSLPIRSEDWEPLPRPPFSFGEQETRLPFEMGFLPEAGRKLYVPLHHAYYCGLAEQIKFGKKKQPKPKPQPRPQRVYASPPRPQPVDSVAAFISHFGSGQKYLVMMSLYHNYWLDGISADSAQSILEDLEMNNIASRTNIDGNDHWFMNEAFRTYVDCSR